MKLLALIFRRPWRMALAVCLLGCPWPVGAAGTEVGVRLSPAQIDLGQAAELSVTVPGGSAGRPALPEVDGLAFTPVGQSSSFQSLNGKTSASVSYLYQVTAQRAGRFVIPAIHAGHGASKPLTLVVHQGAAGSTAQANRPLPPPSLSAPKAEPAVVGGDGSAPMMFLQVVSPRESLYVGELMPVQIKAYFRRGLSAGLDGLPALSSDAFTMTKLTDQPDQSPETVQGIPYTVLTWPAALSAVKAGDYSLSLELPVRVRVKERSGGGRFRDPFDLFANDPFFNGSLFDDFFGRVSEKQVALKSGVLAFRIAALPAAGRPADFSGAVGHFEVQAEVTPRRATVGDPLTLTLTVQGEGSFDRVDVPGLSAASSWKTYRPSAAFEPADSVGYSGRKVFTQAVVPERSGAMEIPTLAFSYFDPDTGKYVTRSTSPLAVEVAASPGVTPQVAVASPEATRSAPASKPSLPPAAGSQGILANATAPGRTVSGLRPVILRPAFAAVPATLLAGLGSGLWLIRRRERRASDSEFLRRQAVAAAVREDLASMDRAVNAGDEATFFTCARRVWQQRLAQVWGIAPQAVTLNEVRTRLADAGEPIAEVFLAADQCAYAGHQLSPADLRAWRDRITELWREMESR